MGAEPYQSEESAPATASRRGAAHDVRTLRAYLTSPEHAEAFKLLHTPHPWRAFLDLGETWGLILVSWALCFYVSALWVPVALLLMGSRQRALGNRLHDAAHGNMLSGRKLNERVASLLCGLPLFEDFELYRLEHLRHHAYLGQPERDPDYLEFPPSEAGRAPSAWHLYSRLVLDPRMWRNSVLVTLMRAPAPHRLRVLAWWAGALGLLSALAGWKGALVFAALWMGARISVYHLIKTFAEISDHVGLVPGSIVSYTRNLPNNGLSFFLHPHHDNYHATHHLFPRIPLANLPRLHQLLMPMELYAKAHHCESYFLGEASVVRSWTHPKPAPESLSPSAF